MLGHQSFTSGSVFVVERLYWRAKALPIGRLRFRWLRTRRERGYDYPEKLERDVREERVA